MFQGPDYTLLDHMAEICEVVDFDLRYVYMNDAAAEREQLSREKLIGHGLLELHPGLQSTPLFRHVQQCLEQRKPVEFEDESSYPNSAVTRWKIRITPIAAGALIQSTGISLSKTKVRIKKQMAAAGRSGGHVRHLVDPWPAGPSNDLLIEGWLDDLDVRTRESREHIFRVADATVALARMAGLCGSEIVEVRNGALLHDIGKIGIPDTVLLKEGRLSAEEWEIVRKHPGFAHDLFSPFEYLRSCLSIPYAHHEKWDGSGYPLGLKGDEIPLAARLFAVVDVWDVLSCDRVYRKAWPQEKIREYIRGQSGRHFDPAVVDLFFHTQQALARL
jgi:HD-GYP domain-containing protein (c-di-GMP phosphodiesterase class II)